MALVVATVAAFVVVFLLWILTLLDRRRVFLEKFPGPPEFPLLGNVWKFISTTDILEISLKYIDKYGPNVKLLVGPFQKAVLTTDYELVEFLLSTTSVLSKSENYKFLAPWLGTGLLTSDGTAKWKKHRKIITPAFHFEILKEFVAAFESAGNVLVEKLSENSNTRSLDIYPLITLCTLDIICETALGAKVDSQNNESSDYVRSVKEMCRIIAEREVSPLKINDFMFLLTRDYRIQKRALRILHGYSQKIINEKITNRSEQEACEDDVGIRKKVAFLDVLLKSSFDDNSLSYEEVREEVDTLMFEGHDTTASSISFVLYCLANNPHVQEKVFQEQTCLFGDDKSPAINQGDLNSMKYLEMAIKETLRLYPSVPFIGRYTTKDVKYKDTVIPAGLNLGVFIYGMHRNPKYFKDPLEFDPDRFNSADGFLPYAYIPFSAGPRNCIGQKFAMFEMKSVIGKVVRNFELLPCPEHTLQLVGETVLKSKNGVRIGLRRRI